MDDKGGREWGSPTAMITAKATQGAHHNPKAQPSEAPSTHHVTGKALRGPGSPGGRGGGFDTGHAPNVAVTHPVLFPCRLKGSLQHFGEFL